MSVSMLSEQLVVAGEDVSAFTTTANGLAELPVEPGKPLLIDGVNTIYFKRITKDHTHLSPALLSHLWKKAREFDVIHIHAWWNLVSVLSCFIAIMRKVPVVVSPRGTLSSYSFHNKNSTIKRIIHSWLSLPLLKKCAIHTTSTNEYEVLAQMLPDNKIFNIPNFINLEEKKIYKSVADTAYLRLIFFSRIEEKKGLDILLDALKLVNVPYKLTIAGDGNPVYVDQLKSIAEKNGIAENINWIGFQTENKYELLYQHDLMVLPSHDENFGNVVIESLSVGTPVLISKQVGLANYVEENSMGWLCDTTPSSVSELINMIANKKEEIIRIKENAPAKISSDFNYNTIVVKYIDMYQQIILNSKN
jgi:glycosyltransferase involved in cell wall biosynthesis